MGDNRKTEKLSPSWVAVEDKASGRTYYANIVTKATSWTRPDAEIEKDIRENGRQSTAKRKKNKKQDVWLERQDPASGKVYYYNPARRETSWYRPDNTIEAGALQADEGKGAWVERQDPRTGRTYYYNPVLGKTSWTNPDAEELQNKKKKDESAMKRLSTSLRGAAVDAGKRLSAGFNRLSFGNSSANRGSARYSLSTPFMPVNKTEGRASLRLGADYNLNLGDDVREAMSTTHDDDKFAKLRAMKNQGVMPQQTEKKDVDYEKPLRIDLRALSDEIDWRNVQLQDFTMYAQEYFNVKKKGMMSGGTMSIQQMRCFQKKPLVQPLHEMSDKSLISDALYGFKTLLTYCGDRASRKSPEYHAKVFLSFGNGTAPELQTEMYAQLIKQTTNNPDPASEEKGWELFALTAGTFLPPPIILPFVQSHMKQAADTPPNSNVKRLAEYAMLRLSKILNLGPRLEVPSEPEISAVRSYTPLNIRLNLVSSTAINMQVETWTTIDEVRKALEFRFQIQDGSPFAVFEVTDEDNERVLEGTDRVLDLVAFWAREIERRRTKKYVPEFQFVYKIRLFFDISEDDTAAIELAYLQAVYEVLDSRYPCSEEDCIKLAALEAQEKFGDFNGSDVFGDKLGAYLPSKFYHEDEEEDIKKRIYGYYAEFQGYDKLLCMVNYLSYVKGWKYYGSAYYFADPITMKLLGKEFPKTVILGINAKGILIIDPPTLDLIAEYPYSELVTWGHSANNFVFVVGNLVRSQKIFFKTKDGLEMNSLIHAYVNKLMEVQPEKQEQEVNDMFY